MDELAQLDAGAFVIDCVLPNCASAAVGRAPRGSGQWSRNRVPDRPDGRCKASSTNPTRQDNYEIAQRAHAEYDSVGFVATGDSIIGDARRPARSRNVAIHPAASRIVERMRTYGEE
jgi:hypothetical protein